MSKVRVLPGSLFLSILFIIINNVYIYSQLEYSEPPVFGLSKNGINSFYIEYQQDDIDGDGVLDDIFIETLTEGNNTVYDLTAGNYVLI